MSTAFGEGPLTVVRRLVPVAGSLDLDGVVTAAREANNGRVLAFSRCMPTAAFSRRDTLLSGYEEAATLARVVGFEPLVRPVGGRLAAYDSGSLVVHLWGPHADPRDGLGERFAAMSACFAAVLRDVGVPDVRIGPVPGEYCSGQWSVNTGGRAKLVGTGQRIFRRSYLFSAVMTVGPAARICELLMQLYPVLGLPLEARSIGSVEDWVHGIATADIVELVASRLTNVIREADGDAAGLAARDPRGSHHPPDAPTGAPP